jgi:hypothetical protein
MIDNNMQPARRAFATELNSATDQVQADEERAPIFSLLPTGAKANRVFVVGTLTEVEDTSNDPNSEYLRARVVDSTGTFFAYAGQYQPEAANFLREADTPMYVAMKAKVKTYETDDGEVNVSLRPEEIAQVTGEDRDRWVVETAQRTLSRIDAYANGDTVDGSDASLYRYGDDLEEYRQSAIEALEEVHGAQVEAEKAEAEAEAEDSEAAEVSA